MAVDAGQAAKYRGQRLDDIDVDGQYGSAFFTTRCSIVQSMVLLSHVVCLSVCLSVTLVDHDHIGCKYY